MAARFALLALVCACDTTIDWVVQGQADYGTVFVCEQGCAAGNEFCFDGDAEALGELKGDTCREITVSDRLWPALVGCAYDCNGRLKGPGANAHCGAFCP